jgi:membrane-bound lytic murein transglycosylase D
MSRPLPLIRILTASLALLLSACATPLPPAPAAPARTEPAPAPVPASNPPTDAAANNAPAGTIPPEEPLVKSVEDDLDPSRPIQLNAPEAQQDLWQRVRSGMGLPDLDGARVEKWETYYAKRPDYVARMMERGGRYLFHITQEVEKRGLPMELALLPFIESAFNPEAMSRVKASGMWQFMSATGKDFDLKQNLFRDDRRDVLASTRAALDYLTQLGRRYNGDWHLALAAYNWGMGNVDRAIRRNAAAGLSTAYTDLRMPTETADYVPKLQAVKNIVMRPEAYGLALPALTNHPYFVTVNIERDIDVALAARLAGIDTDRFRQFNPQMNKPVILAAATPQLLLPYDNASQFVQSLAEHQGATASWTAWQVPRTMKAADAARQVGMTEAGLRELNRIPPRMLVKGGSTLLVPRTAKRDHDVSEHLADTAALALVADRPALRKRTVTARKGDTMASLARRHGVTAARLAEWNDTKPGAKVAAGAKFTLYVAPQRQASAKGSGKRKPSAKAPQTARTQRAKTSR